jgi:hypothetical protein
MQKPDQLRPALVEDKGEMPAAPGGHFWEAGAARAALFARPPPAGGAEAPRAHRGRDSTDLSRCWQAWHAQIGTITPQRQQRVPVSLLQIGTTESCEVGCMCGVHARWSWTSFSKAATIATFLL